LEFRSEYGYRDSTEIIRAGVQIRVWLQPRGTTETEIIRAGVQIIVWLKGLKHKLLGLEFSSEYTLTATVMIGSQLLTICS
jgi:hypothetical protein